MTFVLAARTLRIVVYSQLRTLISIAIVLALAVLFLWTGNRLLNSVTGAASPPPATPTVKPIVEQPTAVPTPVLPTPTATPRHARAAHPTPKPSTHHSHAKPTPTAPPKVFITSSATADNPATTFHVNPAVTRFYCWVRNSTLPPATSAVTFNWVQEKPANQFLTQYPVGKSTFPYTGGFYQGYITQTPGTYRCDVIINGQVFGSTHFTVVP